MTLWERIYIPEILRGLAITNFHFIRNLMLNIAHLFGMKNGVNATATTQYPEQRKHYPDHFRGSHRLTLREDNAVRCTACFLCATACPAQCIYIEAGGSPIRASRSIRCATRSTPCDASIAGSASRRARVTPSGWTPTCIRASGAWMRKDFVETKEQLMHRSTVLAEKGRDGNMQEMQEWYKEQDAAVYDPQRPELKRYTDRAIPLEAEKRPAPEPEKLEAIDRHQSVPGGK